MASLKSSLSPFTVSHSNSLRNSCCFAPTSIPGPEVENLPALKLSGDPNSLFYRNFRVSCNLQEDENRTNSEEPPESLFMKELKRWDMNPTSLLEESKRSIYGDEVKFKEEEGGYSKRNTVSTDYEKSLSNQRELSVALNSEGLEYFGPTFVHDGSSKTVTPPQYIDSYALLEDERTSEIAPHVN